MPHPPLENLRVLIADDSAINRELMRQILQGFGCVSYVAHDGEQVLEYLRDHTIDALILDCAMPGKNGFEVTRIIRRREIDQQLPRLPIIAVTAFVNEETREQCFSVGMDQYVTKPIMPDAIYAALESTLLPKNPIMESLPIAKESIFDMDIEQKMRDKLGNYYITFMQNFQHYAHQQWEDIDHHIIAQNWPEARRKIHQFKGESAQLGIMTIASLCLRLETQLDLVTKDTSHNVPQEIVTQLQQAVESFCKITF